MGLDLPPADVPPLEERTEGWAAGLQLAALSLRGHDDARRSSTRSPAATASSLDYLVEEVLGRQPDDVRDFLLAHRVLDRLTGPLCDALTGRTDGGARCWRTWSGPTCSSSRSTSSASGTATTTCSPTALRARAGSRAADTAAACTTPPAAGTPSMTLLEDAIAHALAGRRPRAGWPT